MAYLNQIDYFTIDTTGDATDFGDLTSNRNQFTGAGSGNRGLFAAGYTGSATVNSIEYVTFDTTGNATDFGDLLSSLYILGACSSGIRAVFGGGYGSPTYVMAYVTIATTGNATDFGDLTVASAGLAGLSGD